ncbi:ABC-three component system middle component 4 [Flavobacterium ginsenosidimutans]|uniref:ABC-three component system middle component 4 n=1 Tax=Flavobacterium ginsenosidimutans TaxID=687844 RepID=A0ABZ2Q7T3_9FLAO
MNLPFYIPDSELNFRLGKLLLIFQVLSTGAKKPIYANLENIGHFEFLLKHPVILNKILNDKDKKVIQLQNSEMYSIEALFLNRAELFDLKSIKILIKLLLSYNYIEFKILSDFKIYYIITNEGLQKAEELQSDYFQRLRNLNLELRPFISLPSSKLGFLIDSHLNYGTKNKNTKT